VREHRVIGPPGTGKTTYLKRQFVIAAEKYGVENCFALSLTKAAASELASRVENVPERNIGTLHSHAYRLLKYPDIVETTKGLKEWNEYCGASSWRIGNQHAANPENAPAEPPGADTDGVEFMQAMGVLRQRMVPRELWPSAVRRFAAKWDAFKVESARMDFTDLIEHGLSSVECIPGAVVMFADEAQDMSRLEFALVRKWGGKCEQFIIVGDPDQNLYEWRGSDPSAFYAEGATSERVLEQSYRVPSAVHEAAVRWIGAIPNRKDAAYRPTPEDGFLDRAGFNYKDPAPLLDDVLHRLDSPRGSVDGETAMVLASCGYMLNPLISELRKNGTPFHNPYRKNHGGWNPLGGSRRLLAFLRPHREVWGDEARMWTWGDLLAWGGVLQASGSFVRGAKGVIENRCVEDRFKDSQRDQPVPPQWLVDNLADDNAREAVFNGDLGWWESRLRHNDRKGQQFSLSVARRHGASKLRERPRLVVGTIHSVKGGEADHVYVFPDLSAAAYWGTWKTNARWPVVRQYYVAMTRSKYGLYLLDPAGQMAVEW
jgi:DNA helicase II / ATP-dependent DNA helicase PcrA